MAIFFFSKLLTCFLTITCLWLFISPAVRQFIQRLSDERFSQEFNKLIMACIFISGFLGGFGVLTDGNYHHIHGGYGGPQIPTTWWQYSLDVMKTIVSAGTGIGIFLVPLTFLSLYILYALRRTEICSKKNI